MPNDEFAYSPVLSQMLASNQTSGKSKLFPELSAASTINNLRVIRKLMLDKKPVKTLEIGLAFGASALAFTSGHRDNLSAPANQHFCIDPFQDTVWDDSGVLNLNRAGLIDFAMVVKKYSSQALPDLLCQGHSFEMIYIDGSHLFEDVFVDYYYSLKLLNLGGLLLFDDSSDAHVKKVLSFIRSNCKGLALEQIEPLSPKEIARKLLGRRQLTIFKKVAEAERTWDSKFVEF